MDKKTFLQSLRNIQRLPSKIDINFDESRKILYIGVDSLSVCKNMQEDASAFEGWIFCIYANRKRGIERVILSWDIPLIKNLHYKRFLYRVLKMQEHFFWFAPSENNVADIMDFKDSVYTAGNLFLNYPQNDSKTENIKEKTEAYFERAFLDPENLFLNTSFDVCNHQLPVGIFRDKVDKEHGLFPYGKSAIDLWAIKADELWIFELKYNNKKVGIISELLFYLWIMEDLCFHHRIRYDLQKKENPSIRDFDKFYYSAVQKNISTIYGVLLVDDLHPAITSELIDFINQENCNKQIIVKTQKYKPHITVKLL